MLPACPIPGFFKYSAGVLFNQSLSRSQVAGEATLCAYFHLLRGEKKEDCVPDK